MKKEAAFQIPKPTEIVQTNFKEIYNSNKNTAFYYIRQILNDLDFTTQDESLIHARIFGNHLYVLSFCPELEVGVPKKFMFDDVKKLKISMPGLYETNRQILNIRSSITKKYQDFVKITLIEIPYQLQVFEVTKTLGFGNYKDYFTLCWRTPTKRGARASTA